MSRLFPGVWYHVINAISVRPTQLAIRQSAYQKFRPSYDLFQIFLESAGGGRVRHNTGGQGLIPRRFRRGSSLFRRVKYTGLTPMNSVKKTI